MEILLSLSVALFAGLMLSRLAKKVQLPAVTAYLVAGILVGPYLLGAFGINGLGFTSHENIKTYGLISDVALGFIAFSIGNEFRLSQLKQIGKKATVIGIFQAVVATLLVDAALIGLHFVMPTVLPLPSAILLGAVASATAPAATTATITTGIHHWFPFFALTGSFSTSSGTVCCGRVSLALPVGFADSPVGVFPVPVDSKLVTESVTSGVSSGSSVF